MGSLPISCWSLVSKVSHTMVDIKSTWAETRKHDTCDPTSMTFKEALGEPPSHPHLFTKPPGKRGNNAKVNARSAHSLHQVHKICTYLLVVAAPVSQWINQACRDTVSSLKNTALLVLTDMSTYHKPSSGSSHVRAVLCMASPLPPPNTNCILATDNFKNQ